MLPFPLLPHGFCGWVPKTYANHPANSLHSVKLNTAMIQVLLQGNLAYNAIRAVQVLCHTSPQLDPHPFEDKTWATRRGKQRYKDRTTCRALRGHVIVQFYVYIYIFKVIDSLLVYIQHMHDLTLFAHCAVGRKRGHVKEWNYAVCYITLRSKQHVA